MHKDDEGWCTRACCIFLCARHMHVINHIDQYLFIVKKKKKKLYTHSFNNMFMTTFVQDVQIYYTMSLSCVNEPARAKQARPRAL